MSHRRWGSNPKQTWLGSWLLVALALSALLSTCHGMRVQSDTITVEIALPAREKPPAVQWPPMQPSSPDIWRKWKPCNEGCID